MVLVCGTALHSVEGQEGRTGTAADSGITGIGAARWATINTDTGDLAPGHRDFSRYNDVRLCSVAARLELAYARQTLTEREHADSIRRVAPDRDSLPSRIANVAKACRNHVPFNISLESLQLALLAGTDSTVQGIVQDQILQPLLRAEAAHAPGQAELRERLLQVDSLYLAAEPARVIAAQRLVAQLDSDPQSDLSTRIRGHVQLMEFWYDHDRFTECNPEIAALYQLGVRDTAATLRKDDLYSLKTAMEVSAVIAFLTHSEGVREIAQRWSTLFRRPAMIRAANQIKSTSSTGVFFHELQTQSVDWLAAAISPYPDTTLRHHAALRPMHADVWFPRTAAATPVPHPGAASLVIPLWECTPSSYLEVLTQRGGDAYDCAGALMLLRRWYKRYASAGLAITIVAQTNGVNTFLGGPKSAQGEAEDIRWYFQTYWHLPVTVAVQTTPFRQDSEPVPFWSVDTTDTAWLADRATQRQLTYESISGEGVWWLVDSSSDSITSIYNKFLETKMFDMTAVILAQQQQGQPQQQQPQHSVR